MRLHNPLWLVTLALANKRTRGSLSSASIEVSSMQAIDVETSSGSVTALSEKYASASSSDNFHRSNNQRRDNYDTGDPPPPFLRSLHEPDEEWADLDLWNYENEDISMQDDEDHTFMSPLEPDEDELTSGIVAVDTIRSLGAVGMDESSRASKSLYSTYFAQPYNNVTTHGRELSETSAAIGTFLPLDCNSNVANVPCAGLSGILPSSGQPLVVPCGACYNYDLGNDQTITFDGGMHIKGLLKFPPQVRHVNIETTFIIVEGELEITTDAGNITPDNESIVFNITGTENINFMPEHAPNINVCNTTGCDLGPKPFLVAGGKVNIQGFPLDSSCNTHTTILDKVQSKIIPDPLKFATFSPLPPSCPVSGIDFIRYDFNNGMVGNWTGYWGGFVKSEDNTLRITNRERTDMGPHLDITPLRPGLCFTPGQDILFSARIKMDKADGTDDGLPTMCKNTTDSLNCPHFVSKVRNLDGNYHHDTKARLYNTRAPNYGEWFDWTYTFQWDEDVLNPTNPYSLLHIYHAELGVDITLDTFRISLPSEASFSDPNDLCGELIVNGDAEANGFHPYPMVTERGQVNVFVLSEEDGNHFFRVQNRIYSSSTIRSFLNVECFQVGVKYLASVKVRIHSENDVPFYFRFQHWGENQGSHYPTYLECPAQRFADGWVTCSGEFTVTEKMAEAENIRWNFHISGDRDHDVTVDFDDISMTQIGYVEKLIVDSDDAQCWGVGSEVHVGTSTFYSFDGNVANSYDTTIDNVSDNGDGTLSLGLAVAPQIPIISHAEDEDFAASVALMTRNFKIVSSHEEEKKGAYLQVLHTPDVAQIIEGVEFDGLGRRGEEDRYPLQFLHSGSVEGTTIDKNSVRRSNMRCIAIQGTGNTTISNNVAASNYGHCVYVGFKSQDNLIQGNFVSNAVQISWRERVKHEYDDQPAAFRNRYGPNNYISNKAVASRHSGFSFDNGYWTYHEDDSYSSPNPRQIPTGEFSHNEARSNGEHGMLLFHHEQLEKIVFSDLKSIKNRYSGIYFYNAHNAELQNSLVAENRQNVQIRWSGDLNVTDTDIRGISSATKHLSHPPYYHNPCTGYYGSPKGLLMPPTIYRWDWTYPDGSRRVNRGTKLTNVNFTLFDHTDECSDSVPISFETGDKRNGHFDYLSSFSNVQVDGVKMVDAKSANDNGIPDIIISDPDGSSDPAGQASGPGSFVSNKQYLKAFAEGNCDLYSEGILYCQNACYRTVQLAVGQTGTSSYELRVTKDDGSEVYIPDIYQYDDNANKTMYHDARRNYYASLPSGQFNLEFYENGNPVWPQFVYETWEAIPDCEGHVDPQDVTIVEPELSSGECDDLIRNGDMEQGINGWLHRNGGGESKYGYLEAVQGAGIGGSMALGYLNRRGYYDGIGQNLDTRCFHQNMNAYYEIKAWFRLENETEAVICDPMTNDYPDRCPLMTLKNVRYLDPETRQELDWDYDQRKATTVATQNRPDGFNLLHGVMPIDEKYNAIHTALMYIEHFHTDFDMILDDFSITKMDGVCLGNFVRNGDFDVGDSRFWKEYGTSKWEMVDVGGGKGLKVYDRGHDSHGIMQYLHVNMDCVNEFDRFLIRVNYSLQDSDGNSFECDSMVDNEPNECAAMRVKSYSYNDGSPHPYIGDTSAVESSVSQGVTTMDGIFTFDAGAANHHTMYWHMFGPHMDNSFIIHDVSFEPLPKSCQQVVVNPSFDDGSSAFWNRYRRATRVSIIKDSVDDNFSLLFRRDEHHSNINQELDTRCIVAGQDFVLSAKLRFFNATDLSEPLGCNPSDGSVYSENACPQIRLRGQGCNNDFHYNFQNQKDVAWKVDAFNDFEFDVVVDENMASCTKITVELGYYLHLSRALLIDDIMFSQKTTFAPTASPTFFPTKPLTTGPTLKPTIRTNAPTTQVSVTCPPIGSTINIGGESAVFSIAEPDSLCTLTKVISSDNAADVMYPLARSYNSHPWEVSAGSFALATFGGEEFLCYDRGCQINLPALEDGAVYQVTSSAYTLSTRDEYARFLETASFGATSSDIDNFEGTTSIMNGAVNVIADFVESQMDVEQIPMTSHRELWRERTNPRLLTSVRFGMHDHPCDTSSRWRKYTFTRHDRMWQDGKALRVQGPPPYILTLHGSFRTVVDDFWLGKNETYTFDPDFEYELCNTPEEWSGGRLWIRLEDGNCVQAENPPLSVDGHETEVQHILNLPDTLIRIDERGSNGEIFILPSGLDVTLCEAIPKFFERSQEPVFGKLPDGSWLQFDPRLNLESNTLESPLPDGGKSTGFISRGETYCSNVPRTFLNEDTCIFSAEGCKPSASNSDIQILLEDDTLKRIFNLTSRYVYGLKGLNVVDPDFKWELPHPCTASERSRWLRKDLTDCEPTNIYSGTNATLTDLLSNDGDLNPYIRDIYFPETGQCNATDTDPSIEIIVKDTCWKRVHDDYFSIYDMTYWVTHHPGGSAHIMKWNTTGFLTFPNGHPVNNHPMARWHNNRHKFTYVGRYGDNLKVRDLPNELRKPVTDYYLSEANIDTTDVLVCGSPGEVENDRSSEFAFDIADGFDTGFWNRDGNKKSVWAMAALNAPDQLRQRVAWGLSQILVVVNGAIGSGGGQSEWFLSYYDIFIRNAFGNYRDILREISYSPIMAENLSFLDSKSSAYVWERYRLKAQADENFAREIMQLFSMGLIQLNSDGSPKLKEDGETSLAYTNEDIMSLSRAWTGFNLQPRRGNIEGWDNRLDPMKIEATWRDKFPKSDTTGGYIGDYYPLCEDIPDKGFLQEGAKYRFLGSSSMPELMVDPSNYETDERTVRMVLDQTSGLRERLCNPDASGNCQFSNTVTLPNTISCVDVECEVETLRVVQISEDAFYEYVRAPCVNQAFFNGGKKISPYAKGQRIMCGNPSLVEASAACCSFASTWADMVSKYEGERMPYASADERCSNESKFVCDFYRVRDDYNKRGLFFWTPDDCQVRLKVKSDGMVTIVHQTADGTDRQFHLEEDNENWFKVYWEDSTYPLATNGCDGVCDVINGDACLCGTSVMRSRGYRSTPSSIGEMTDKLFIGSFDPRISDPQSYSSTTDPTSGITTHLRNDIFDSATVFEFHDDKGRQYFVKNSIETVRVLNLQEGSTGYSFRNAPQFMSFVPSETTLRDAQYETEATLDHYFYHDNTGPFLSMRLIQRLVSSNPSPRYVKVVAKAFKEGTYESSGKVFGSGQYGDMAAMFSAIYLDREARSIVLDADPSSGALREPLLKIISVLRSMDLQSNFPLLVLDGNVKRNVGQMVHEFESVFSFFLPEFVPYGRVGDATLVSPEATLLDMPRIVGMLNGLISLVENGLSNCYGGFGGHSCRDQRRYRPQPYGHLEFNRTSSDAEFSYETFEGMSLNGGFDNSWSGRDFHDYHGTITKDPQDESNHVFLTDYVWHAALFSQPVIQSESTVVKFRFLGSAALTGGCIGYSDVDTLYSETWTFCHVPSNWNWAPNTMVSDNTWVACQFEVPSDMNQFRIALGDRRAEGDAYFDDIQIGIGSGTFCHSPETPVTIEDKSPPGVLNYSEAIVDELATLLTAGRLSQESRRIIRNAYDSAGSANDGLRVAQELILTTSEFHSTNIIKPKNEERDVISFPPLTGKPYKAVVYVMFSGGCDSYNMLMPHTCPESTYDSFMDIRAQVAIAKDNLLPIDADDQVCSKFGLHPDFSDIQSLYNDNDLMFFANTGVMTRPVDKSNYQVLTNTQLFAHNHQQQESKRIDPYERSSGTGVLGRMSDALDGLGHNTGSFSVDRFSIALVGVPGISAAPMIVNNNGVPNIHLDEIDGMIGSLHNVTEPNSGFFGETWSDELMKALITNDLLSQELSGIETNIEFPTSYLSRQFETVSKLIRTRESRGVDTDTFYVEIGGFDTHSNVEEALSNRFTEVNESYKAFADELKAMGLWDNVVTIQTSDFARTLNPNSGDGTDHAWAGNYMMMGGSVAGGQIAGIYPDDFSDEAPLNIGRGRMIPTTPWDAVFSAIATWLEIPNSALTDICPNLYNFDTASLFDPRDLFVGIPEPVPTSSPTSSPPTTIPSNTPSVITSHPSAKPSLASSPTINPSSFPTKSPSNQPSASPVILLSNEPSVKPSKTPSTSPSIAHSEQPSIDPSRQPTLNPSGTPAEVAIPTSDQPSSGPSHQPSSGPSHQPSIDPSHQPTLSPSGTPAEVPIPTCSQNGKDRYFIKMNNQGQPKFSTCAELEARGENIRSNHCGKVDFYNNIGPAKLVCPKTCDSCNDTWAPSTLSSSEPSSRPSPVGGNCVDNPTDRYYVKTINGRSITKNCKNLSKKSENVQNNHCNKTKSDPVTGMGPAREVCREICGTCP